MQTIAKPPRSFARGCAKPSDSCHHAVVTTPPPLPTPVPFAVYGLPGDGDGPRNLVLWNQPDWLWTVTLAHGDEGDAVLVTTIRREPRPPAAGEEWERLPNDLEVAALDAVTSAVERAGPRRAARAELLDAELDRIDVTGAGVVLEGWDATVLRVDTAPVAASTRVVANTRIVVLDLPAVVVAVEAPHDRTAPVDLVDVRGRLAHGYPWPATPA